jgi:hypothetical protein
MVMARIALAGACLVLGVGPSLAKDCRVPEAPPGVRVQPPVGCEPTGRDVRKGGNGAALRAGTEPGFIDLGGGTQVRVGGRVRVEAGTRR